MSFHFRSSGVIGAEREGTYIITELHPLIVRAYRQKQQFRNPSCGVCLITKTVPTLETVGMFKKDS